MFVYYSINELENGKCKSLIECSYTTVSMNWKMESVSLSLSVRILQYQWTGYGKCKSLIECSYTTRSICGSMMSIYLKYQLTNLEMFYNLTLLVNDANYVM